MATTLFCSRGEMATTLFCSRGEMATTLPSWASILPNQFSVQNLNHNSHSTALPSSVIKSSSRMGSVDEKDCSKRRLILVGTGALAASLVPTKIAFAEEVPEKYQAFVDFSDGYSYYYPSDWRDFDFRGHDSAFKDRFAALQHVRVCFIPTNKKDVRDLGSMEEVIFNLVKNVYAAPTQTPTIYDMQEHTIDRKNYWTFEYELTSPNFSRTAFATIAIGNGIHGRAVLHARCGGERETVEQSPEQAQSGCRLFQNA